MQDQGEHLNDVVRSLTEANPADPASGPLDPSGLKYRRLVQELQASTAPAPTRQLPSQVASAAVGEDVTEPCGSCIPVQLPCVACKACQLWVTSVVILF